MFEDATLFIKDYLVNGSVTGLCVAQKRFRPSQAYRIPRAELKHCDKDKEWFNALHSPGVYFMFGQNDKSSVQDKASSDFVYIGEGTDVLKRIRIEHNFEKEGKGYWQDVIVLVAGSHFNETIIKRLEKLFIRIAENAGRYDVMNSNKMLNKKKNDDSDDDPGSLKETVEEAKLLLFHLGHRVLEPQPSRTNIAEEDYLFFSRKTKNGEIVYATGVRKEDGFWVLKDSVVSKDIAKYLSPGYKGLRKQYERFIKKQKLTINIRFNSPSAASSFVCGKNSNGLVEWKNKDGISLKYLDDDSRPEKPGSSAPVKTKRKPKQEKTKKTLPAGVELLHFSGEKFHAEGYMIDDKQIVVLKDSTMNPDIRKSCDDLYRNDRNDLIKSGKVKDFVFSENVTFPNTSRAAAVIAGGNSSGPDSWKDAKGRKLKDVVKR